MRGLSATRIPYLRAANALRADPITGCDNGPEVCAVLARGLCWAENGIKRYCAACKDCVGQECPGYDFRPRYHPEVLDAIRRLRKPRVIAVGFGGDMWSPGVRQEWRDAFWETVQDCPQHTYVTLTKRPNNIDDLNVTLNAELVWFGVSVTQPSEQHRISQLDGAVWEDHHRWVSFEPVLSGGWSALLAGMLHRAEIQYIVIGGLSDGAGRLILPEQGGTRPEWIQPLVDSAWECRLPVFLKNLAVGTMRQVIDPRVGRPFSSMFDWREIPAEWERATEAGG